MKLKSISVINFRQFWHQVKIDFSCDEDKNITVVHGANGSGKTSLLNAFKWCFYGKTDFDTNTEHILNESAISATEIGKTIEVKVVVIFEDSGCTYEVVRSDKFIKKQGLTVEKMNLSSFFIIKIDSDGLTHKIEAANSEINRVLPESLQPYFFFNGERIEKLAGVNESKQIKEAIKRLMGLKQVERAQRHLDKVAKEFRSEVASHLDNDSKGLVDSITALEEEIDEVEEVIQRELSSISEVEMSIQEIDKQLDSYKELKHLQEMRYFLSEKNKEIELLIDDNIQRRKNLLDRNRAILLANPIIQKCKDLVEDNRKKGILPYKIRATFIDDIIETNHCICGRDLDEVSIKTLLFAKKTAGDDELDMAYSYVNSYINNYSQQYKDYNEDLSVISSESKRLITSRDKNSLDLSEISVKIKSSENVNISGLENKRVELYEKRDAHVHNLKHNQEILPMRKMQLDVESRKWEKLKVKQKLQSSSQSRLDSTLKISNALYELNKYFTETVRDNLSKRVNSTFDKIIRKNMSAYIDDSFRLRVEKLSPDGLFDAVEQSTGEKQVTSLSFISSIISLAKEKHSAGSKFFKGGVYPLVMDSPFGALDDDYRYKVAQSVSNLADQVVMFVSNSQWNGNVKNACEHKVGKCYKLVHFSNSPAAKSMEHHDFLRYTDCEVEYSSIEEVDVL